MNKFPINFILFITICGSSAFAQLKLPAVIDDNMVLQRDRANNIWGWATPGETISLVFMNKNYTSPVNKNGEWKITLSPAKAGTGGEMRVSCGKEEKIIKHILIGEVWLCSGQSNMEFTMGGFRDFYRDEIKMAKDENIRFVVIKNTFNNKEATDAELRNAWSSVDSTTIMNCSAVAYFFAKKLRERLKVPVGLVISSWGGTPAQSWVDMNTLKAFPNYAELYDKTIKPLDFSNLAELKKRSEDAYHQKIIGAISLFREIRNNDYHNTDWETATLPKNWEQHGHPDLDGIAAYRISFTVPAGSENKTAVLHLPAIDDIDSTYINGSFIGSGTVWNELRVYNVPANILKAGENIITVWVEDDGGGGGLNADPDNYFIQLQNQKIWLKGEAKFRILAQVENNVSGTNYAFLQYQPAVLFNAMIAPLLQYGIRGVTWYQGESNVPRYVEYRALFPALINCWRKRFSQKDLPFLFVQLASYNPDITEPAESDWAGLREAQQYALQLPNTGMAVTIDVGDQKDIHPKRKKEVGERLAANAFNIVYGYKNDVPAGPLYKSSAIDDNTIKISYNNIGKGLMHKGSKLLGFTIAGNDKHFVEADAFIKGNEVFVSSSTISSPLYVRYAWANAPMDANLYNKDGYPAAPFRTDK